MTLSKEEEAVAEEQQILDTIDTQYKPLMSVQDIAKGVEYTEAMKTSWRPPSHVRSMTFENGLGTCTLRQRRRACSARSDLPSGP